jgi:hypothetical protein
MAITVGRPTSGLSVVGHEWTGTRGLVMRELGEIQQLRCRWCCRDFVRVLSTGAVQAVAPFAISFWMLSPEVSERWIANCLGERLESDVYDRMRRVREITFA